jgi:hypothetical protein
VGKLPGHIPYLRACFGVYVLQGFPVHLPTFVARMLAFKLSIDTSKLPAVGDLLRSMAR